MGSGANSVMVNTVAFDTGLTGAEFQSRYKTGKPMENRDIYNNIRVVAGGFRIYETTHRENRGGIIRSAHAHRGLGVRTSLSRAVQDVPSGSNAKVYLSSNGGVCRGRRGFHLGGTYRPKDYQETSTFSNANAVFANEETFREFEKADPNDPFGAYSNATVN